MNEHFFVVVQGEQAATLSAELCRALSRDGGVCAVLANQVLADRPFRYTLLSQTGPVPCEIGPAVYVYAGGKNSLPPPEDGSVAVIEHTDTAALSLLKDSGTPAVICGLSHTDTLSLSSVGEPSCVAVSLQRELTTLNGALCEAMEVSVHLSAPCSEFGVMAACAVLLLCTGEIEVMAI